MGNLPWATTDEDLQQIFAPYEPYDCHVKTNMAGRSRGFGILRSVLSSTFSLFLFFALEEQGCDTNILVLHGEEKMLWLEAKQGISRQAVCWLPSLFLRYRPNTPGARLVEESGSIP